ncbi:VOC family protein, partial [Sphingobium xenophagum]
SFRPSNLRQACSSFTIFATEPADGQAIIVFMTEDLDGLLERVQANGGRVTEEQTIPEHGYKLAFWRDPEGNLIESAQRI